MTTMLCEVTDKDGKLVARRQMTPRDRKAYFAAGHTVVVLSVAIRGAK